MVRGELRGFHAFWEFLLRLDWSVRARTLRSWVARCVVVRYAARFVVGREYDAHHPCCFDLIKLHNAVLANLPNLLLHMSRNKVLVAF